MSSDARVLSRSLTIDAAPSVVFDLLADPRRHADIDGSDTVRAQLRGPQRLSPGARFGMRMHKAVPYIITNTVVAFEQDRVLAWRHLGRHVWRYELEPVEGGGTRVTESFEWGGALVPALLERLNIPASNARAIEKTLPRLKALAEQPTTPPS